jgi:type IV pilus assembly protein PilV
MPPPAVTHRQRGFSLLELLVALIVVSLGLGSVLYSQARGMQALNGNSWRAQAAVLAEHMIDRARANPAGNYTLLFTDTPGTSDVVGRDLTAWRGQLQRSLPAGTGEITLTPRTDTVTGRVFDEINVVIRWDDRRGGAGDSGSDQLRHMRVQGLRAQP